MFVVIGPAAVGDIDDFHLFRRLLPLPLLRTGWQVDRLRRRFGDDGRQNVDRGGGGGGVERRPRSEVGRLRRDATATLLSVLRRRRADLHPLRRGPPERRRTASVLGAAAAAAAAPADDFVERLAKAISAETVKEEVGAERDVEQQVADRFRHLQRPQHY